MTASATLHMPGPAYWIAPLAGLAWNAFGIYQFVTAATASREGLVARGMTVAQAELYAGLPGWMTAAFAIGVFGGLVGCLLLLIRRTAALPVLAMSLAGYLVLYVGDITEGVFAAFGMQQVVTLTAVVLIAVGLLGFARSARSRGMLA